MVLDLVKVEPKKVEMKLILIILAILLLLIIIGICSFFIVKNQIQIRKQNIQTEQKIIEKQNAYTHYNMIRPTIKQTQNIIEQVNSIYNSDEKRVFLTFDDGPSKNVTPLILDLLKQENIKATFFLLGSRVNLNPEIVKRQYEEGHYVTNHGYSHVYSSIYASPQSVIDEYNMTEETIRNAIGKPDYNSYLFRFPGGTSRRKIQKNKTRSKNYTRTKWNSPHRLECTNSRCRRKKHSRRNVRVCKTNNRKQKQCSNTNARRKRQNFNI